MSCCLCCDCWLSELASLRHLQLQRIIQRFFCVPHHRKSKVTLTQPLPSESHGESNVELNAAVHDDSDERKQMHTGGKKATGKKSFHIANTTTHRPRIKPLKAS